MRRYIVPALVLTVAALAVAGLFIRPAQSCRQDNPTTIVVTAWLGDTSQLTPSPVATQALKIGGTGFFTLRVEIADTAAGPRLGGFNLPGRLHFYLNIECRLMWWTLLSGHIEFS